MTKKRSGANGKQQAAARKVVHDYLRRAQSQDRTGVRFGRTRSVAANIYIDPAKQAKRQRQVAQRPPNVEEVPITAADGTELAAEVHAPEPTRTRGAIIFVHGFGGNKGENGLFHALAARCVHEGFAAVLYDWRGIAQSKGDFPSSTLDDHRSDFEQVAQWTQSRFGTTIDSLHAVGFSLGAAVIGLALDGRLDLTSVIYLSPASRPRRSMWPRYEQLWNEVEPQDVIEKPGSSVLLGRSILESLRDTDLGPDAFDLKVPLLVCHGTDDVRVDLSHTRELVKQRDRTGDFCFIVFKGASHSFRPAGTCWDELGNALTTWLNEPLRLTQLRRARRKSLA